MRRTHAVAVAVMLAGTPLAAQTTQQSQPGAPSTTVTLVGCVQREERNALTGVRSPSGFVLMNASTSPYGGGVGNDPATPAATSGSSGGKAGTDERPRSGDQTPARSGGSNVSPGLTFLLDGPDLDAHAGERVEVRGTLQPATTKLRLMPDSARAGSANLPQRLKVESVKTLAKDCSR